jgi:hypothetical protein
VKKGILLLLISSLLLLTVLPVEADQAASEADERSADSSAELLRDILPLSSVIFSDSLQEERKSLHTFEDTVVLRGEGTASGRLLVWIYTRTDAGEVVLWDQQEQSLGASGLYSLSLALPCFGEQQVVVLFLQDHPTPNLCERILYLTCCRHDPAVQEELETARFNLYTILGGAS